MNNLAQFLLARLDEDLHVERSLKRAIDATRTTPGGETAALFDLYLREWAAAEPRSNENWRGLVAGAIRAHEASLAELLPNRVGAADAARMTRYEAFALVLRNLAQEYEYHPDYLEEWRA